MVRVLVVVLVALEVTRAGAINIDGGKWFSDAYGERLALHLGGLRGQPRIGDMYGERLMADAYGERLALHLGGLRGQPRIDDTHGERLMVHLQGLRGHPEAHGERLAVHPRGAPGHPRAADSRGAYGEPRAAYLQEFRGRLRTVDAREIELSGRESEHVRAAGEFAGRIDPLPASALGSSYEVRLESLFPEIVPNWTVICENVTKTHPSSL